MAVTFAWKTRVLSSGQMRSVIPHLFIIFMWTLTHSEGVREVKNEIAINKLLKLNEIQP